MGTRQFGVQLTWRCCPRPPGLCAPVMRPGREGAQTLEGVLPCPGGWAMEAGLADTALFSNNPKETLLNLRLWSGCIRGRLLPQEDVGGSIDRGHAGGAPTAGAGLRRRLCVLRHREVSAGQGREAAGGLQLNREVSSVGRRAATHTSTCSPGACHQRPPERPQLSLPRPRPSQWELLPDQPAFPGARRRAQFSPAGPPLHKRQSTTCGNALQIPDSWPCLLGTSINPRWDGHRPA